MIKSKIFRITSIFFLFCLLISLLYGFFETNFVARQLFYAQPVNPIVEITEKIDDVNLANSNLSSLDEKITSEEKQVTKLSGEIIILKEQLKNETDESKIKTIQNSIDEKLNLKNKTLDTITELNKNKNELKNSKAVEVKELQQNIVQGSIQTSFLIFSIIAIWVLFELYLIFISKLIKQTLIRSWVNKTGFVLCLIATITIGFYLLAPNISLILTSLGLLSAAFVVVFQDILASLISYLIIRSQRLYKEGDTVRFATPNGIITGKIKNIKPLRTYGEEVLDDKNLNQSEQTTYKLISIPNNVVLKSAIVNFSKNNSIIKEKLELIITFSSDLQKAKALVEEYFTNWDEKIAPLSLKRKAKSDIFVDIAEDGPRFTIWFPVKLGQVRQTRGFHVLNLLSIFKNNGVDLAFKTITVQK